MKGGIFMKKFELFICSLGNGLTVCNKAVMENGDYKHIAYISNCGKIKWYVDYIHTIFYVTKKVNNK